MDKIIDIEELIGKSSDEELIKLNALNIQFAIIDIISVISYNENIKGEKLLTFLEISHEDWILFCVGDKLLTLTEIAKILYKLKKRNFNITIKLDYENEN